MIFKSKTVFTSKENSIFFNNENLYKTIVWLHGNLGQKKYILPNELNVKTFSNSVSFLTFKSRYFKNCGSFHTILRNDIYGFLRNFKSWLVVKGLGFKIFTDNKTINFKIGFSHNVVYLVPSGIKISVLPKKSRAFCISGSDYQVVKEITARIRNFKKPSSYKNQGIFFFGENRKLKDSKKKSR